jgi:hypothetical protein
MAMKQKKVIRQCTRCGRRFVAGRDGILGYNKSNVSFCDTCAGVTRDSDGVAFLPWEQSVELRNPDTGQTFTVTR